MVTSIHKSKFNGFSASNTVEGAINFQIFGYPRNTFRLKNAWIRAHKDEHKVDLRPQADAIVPKAIELKKRMQQGYEIFLAETQSPGETRVADRTCCVVRNLEGFKLAVQKLGWPTKISVRDFYSITETQAIASWIDENLSNILDSGKGSPEVVNDFPGSSMSVTAYSILKAYHPVPRPGPSLTSEESGDE